MNRRDALKTISLSTGALAAASLPTLAIKAEAKEEHKVNKSNKTRVIVCGGGFGGLTVAKYLKQFNRELEVLLIEKNSHFISCPYSNIWLGGIDHTTLQDLSYDYLTASDKYGYEFINETIVDINRHKMSVTTNNTSYKYDYLVLSPGIDYDYSKIFKSEDTAKKAYRKYPPAMKPGSEHLALKRKVENFTSGNFIINIPSGTYRCPPAPYERACMIAYYFKARNIKAKVIVIDPREKPGAKAEGFLSSFKELYKDYIEYKPLTQVKNIDFEKKYIEVDSFDKTELDYVSKKIKFEDANIIPNMKPSKLITKAGLKLTPKGWAELKAPGFESVTDDRIIVVGDSNGHPYPKSGHMANSCGYIAAKDLAYKTLKKTKKNLELPANICYSMVNGSPQQGISVHHNVTYDPIKGLKVSSRSTPRRDRATGEIIKEWYNAIISDIL